MATLKPGRNVQYFASDRLGSARTLFPRGESAWAVDYYPFGFVEAQNGSEGESRFGFTGHETDFATDLVYAGARYYDPEIGRWLQVDPLASKYPGWSPYNYSLNNPIILVDRDGRKVVFADGVSKEFKQQFAIAVAYLNKHGAGGMLAELHASETVYYVTEEATMISSYDPKTRTLAWNPTVALLTNEDHELSPTSILNHEVDHALQHDQNPEQQKKDADIQGGPYQNKEEERVVTGSEQETARKLGEIKPGEVTRKDHAGGYLYHVADPTSTEDVNPIIVTPQEDK